MRPSNTVSTTFKVDLAIAIVALCTLIWWLVVFTKILVPQINNWRKVSVVDLPTLFDAVVKIERGVCRLRQRICCILRCTLVESVSQRAVYIDVDVSTAHGLTGVLAYFWCVATETMGRSFLVPLRFCSHQLICNLTPVGCICPPRTTSFAGLDECVLVTRFTRLLPTGHL